MSQSNSSILAPLEYAEKIRHGIAKKADNSKRMTRALIGLGLVASVSTPILVLAEPDVSWYRFVPAGIGAIAAAVTGWLNLRKPHVRWEIYRTAQRDIEYQIDQFKYGNGDYDNNPDAGKILADRVSKRAHKLHYDWLPTIPSPSNLSDNADGT